MSNPDHEALLREVAKALIDVDPTMFGHHESHIAAKMPGAQAAMAIVAKRLETVTPEMDAAARDWSKAKYGIGIGHAASRPCWLVQLAASPLSPGRAEDKGREVGK